MTDATRGTAPSSGGWKKNRLLRMVIMFFTLTACYIVPQLPGGMLRKFHPEHKDLWLWIFIPSASSSNASVYAAVHGWNTRPVRTRQIGAPAGDHGSRSPCRPRCGTVCRYHGAASCSVILFDVARHRDRADDSGVAKVHFPRRSGASPAYLHGRLRTRAPFQRRAVRGLPFQPIHAVPSIAIARSDCSGPGVMATGACGYP